MKKITIKEIADNLGLSVATVSRAINPHTQHLVTALTRKRVSDLVKQYQYVPNIAAKRLVTGMSRNIVIFFRPQVASLFFDDYYSKLIAGAMSAVDTTDYHLNLSVMKVERGGFNVAKAIRTMDVAGAIICNFFGVFNVSTKNIFELGIPVIILNPYKDGDNPSCYMIDNYKSMYEATKYLISLGHKRIGFVRGSANIKDAQDRYFGHLQALKDCGIPLEPRLNYQSDFRDETGIKAARYYFSGKFEPPSALLFTNDPMAITALNELRQMGVPCPEQVSVVGFDGLDAGRFTDPPLTSAGQPTYEIASDSVRQIIQCIETKEIFVGSKYFTAKIIERSSTMPFTKRKGDRLCLQKKKG